MDKQHKSELDYNYIGDGIYIGTNQCCQMHFDEELLKKGVTVDISLEETRIDQPFGVELYEWIPVMNHYPPSPDQLKLGVASLEKIIEMKKKVYLHCKNGHGRAPTLVAAYFIKHNGKSPKEAEEFIKSKRPSMHLRDSQREALEKFAKDTSK